MDTLEWVNCSNCRKHIGRVYLEGDSRVELMCRSCRAMTVVTAKTPKEPSGYVPDGMGGYAPR